MHNITTPSQQPGTHRGQDRRFQPVLDTAPAAGSRGRPHERALGLLSLAVSPLVSPLATTSVTSSLKFVLLLFIVKLMLVVFFVELPVPSLPSVILLLAMT